MTDHMETTYQRLVKRFNITASEQIVFEADMLCNNTTGMVASRDDRDVLVANVAAALQAAYERGRAESEAKMADLLSDPFAVRVNYLAGKIAMQGLLDEEREHAAKRAWEFCMGKKVIWKFAGKLAEAIREAKP